MGMFSILLQDFFHQLCMFIFFFRGNLVVFWERTWTGSKFCTDSLMGTMGTRVILAAERAYCRKVKRIVYQLQLITFKYTQLDPISNKPATFYHQLSIDRIKKQLRLLKSGLLSQATFSCLPEYGDLSTQSEESFENKHRNFGLSHLVAQTIDMYLDSNWMNLSSFRSSTTSTLTDQVPKF